jgi:hypothetical protein
MATWIGVMDLEFIAARLGGVHPAHSQTLTQPENGELFKGAGHVPDCSLCAAT